MRRIAARTWLLVIGRSAFPYLGLRALGRLGQQVLELQREPFEVTDLLLRRRRQERVGDDAGDGDAETHGGVVQRLGDTFREQRRPLFRLRGRDGAERANQTDDGTEEADEGGDVGDRPEDLHALLQQRRHVDQRLLDRLGNRDLAAVNALETGPRDLRDGRLGRRAQLHGAVDVVGQYELANLLEERLRVHRPLAEEEDGAVDDDGQGDDRHHQVDVHQGATLL